MVKPGFCLLPALLLIKLSVLSLWLPLLAAMERARPSAKRPLKSDAPRLTRNLGLWLANTALSPLLTVPITALAASHAFWARPDWALGWPFLLLDLLILDAWIYAWHRANHENPWLWRFHQVHHLDEFLDVSTGLRFHPLEVLLSALARAVLILALAIPLRAVLVYEVLVLASAAFHHSNLRIAPGLEAKLRWVIVTPSHHWVHHHALRRDTDSNYATMLTLWDRLFGSLSLTRRDALMPIGLEGAKDASLARLAILPFTGGRQSPRVR